VFSFCILPEGSGGGAVVSLLGFLVSICTFRRCIFSFPISIRGAVGSRNDFPG